MEKLYQHRRMAADIPSAPIALHGEIQVPDLDLAAKTVASFPKAEVILSPETILSGRIQRVFR